MPFISSIFSARGPVTALFTRAVLSAICPGVLRSALNLTHRPMPLRSSIQVCKIRQSLLGATRIAPAHVRRHPSLAFVSWPFWTAALGSTFGLVLFGSLRQPIGLRVPTSPPNASGSEDEEVHSAEIPEGHRPGDGLHSRPAGPPPPTPAGADARLVYNATVPPDLNFLPGSMRSVHVTRRFPAPMIIRWVQNRLIRHQQGLLPATAFLNGPIPQGTPFRFHNPFTSRAQCHEVGYQEPEHIPPLGVLQAHADNRGWRGVVLLNPQPDSAAVHLIALPQHGHLASIGLLVNNRLVPCCVPRRARWRDLRGIAFEGVRGRLDLPRILTLFRML